MTKEWRDALIKLFICCAFAILYALGGEGYLWVRRFLAPVILLAGMGYFSRDWKVVFGFSGIGTLCLGYGADDLTTKIIKRAVFGLANGLSFSIPNLANKRYLLGIFQISLVTATSVLFGVWNPFHSAIVEQRVIGFEIAFIPLMSAKN